MPHDFKKLNWFESAAIGLMALGIVLIGVIFFYALPQNGQMNIKKSVAFLDVHQEIGKPLETIQLVLDTPSVYLGEFGLLADYFGGIYEEQYSSKNNYGDTVKVATGRVLGASYKIKDEREKIKENKYQTYSDLSDLFDLSIINQKFKQLKIGASP